MAKTVADVGTREVAAHDRAFAGVDRNGGPQIDFVERADRPQTRPATSARHLGVESPPCRAAGGTSPPESTSRKQVRARRARSAPASQLRGERPGEQRATRRRAVARSPPRGARSSTRGSSASARGRMPATTQQQRERAQRALIALREVGLDRGRLAARARRSALRAGSRRLRVVALGRVLDRRLACRAARTTAMSIIPARSSAAGRTRRASTGAIVCDSRKRLRLREERAGSRRATAGIAADDLGERDRAASGPSSLNGAVAAHERDHAALEIARAELDAQRHAAQVPLVELVARRLTSRSSSLTRRTGVLQLRVERARGRVSDGAFRPARSVR